MKKGNTCGMIGFNQSDMPKEIPHDYSNRNKPSDAEGIEPNG
jgi:hypothetical protein